MIAQLSSVLERAGGKGARSVIFATGDDLVNIEAAFAAYEHFMSDTGPVRLLWTHIADEKLADVLRSAVRTRGRVGIRFFDTYTIAAERMVDGYFGPDARSGLREIVIAGYGKFGNDLLGAVAAVLDDAVSVRVLDRRDLESSVMRNSEALGLGGRIRFSREDIRELSIGDDMPRAFFLCTDDDLGNLSLALTLAERAPGNRIFVRMGHWPLQSVSEQLGRDMGLVFININDLISQGLRGIAGIFNPAAESDLKRLDPDGTGG